MSKNQVVAKLQLMLAVRRQARHTVAGMQK
jgi:hypothetical protein